SASRERYGAVVFVDRVPERARHVWLELVYLAQVEHLRVYHHERRTVVVEREDALCGVVLKHRRGITEVAGLLQVRCGHSKRNHIELQLLRQVYPASITSDYGLVGCTRVERRLSGCEVRVLDVVVY